MRTRWTMSMLLVVITFLLPACRGTSGSGTAGSASTKLTVAVIPKATSHEYWKGVHAGALAAGKELNVDILWQGPAREDDREEQIKVVDTIRSRGVSGIVLAPLDNKALRTPVTNAVRAGIPVVVIDSQLDSQDYRSIVETDNYEGGKAAGATMTKLLDGKGPVLMLRMQEGSASTTQREQGFLDALATAPGIKVVSSNQYGGVTVESAFKASENLLMALRAAQGGVAGVFCPNESTTFGMLRALQNSNLAGKLRFVGFDGNERLLQAMRDNQIDALVVQDPFGMGYTGVKTLITAIKGGQVEKKINTGATVVTRENMDQPELQRRLYPARALDDVSKQ
jgi:ribose transport system substrate-binding protein